MIEREHIPGNEQGCQDCGGCAWQASLLTAHGRLYLCYACADEALVNRESNSPRQNSFYDRLLRRAFKGNMTRHEE